MALGGSSMALGGTGVTLGGSMALGGAGVAFGGSMALGGTGVALDGSMALGGAGVTLGGSMALGSLFKAFFLSRVEQHQKVALGPMTLLCSRMPMTLLKKHRDCEIC